MNYVESVIYSLLINGDQVGYIKPGRGLCQGNPLYPYLFIICTEGLISLLEAACSRGELEGLKLGPGLESMTHLMFADDTLLVGQLVNTQKSTILFSPNVSEDTRKAIIDLLGIPEVAFHGKYLGLPIRLTLLRKKFSSIINRVKAKVDNWKPRLLSTADITTQKKKIHWLAWHTLCKPKHEGGLGFRDTQSFSQALLCKQTWKFITEPDSSLSRIYKAKYFPKGDFWTT
ncbi:hypothetical protein LIER_34638 [Lithospermum erythrorhizon]|uniref:Reverse transcriptase domain-containing protein n=1 Tax=Lithospermum erythrorhizon TaxID=34254 RepID=A0AAV3S2V4_LITER